MDLNQILYHHQIAVMNRQNAQSKEDRLAQFDLVEYYSKRLREFRVDAGLPRYVWPDACTA
ncbi:hypothetical protein G6N82_12365 [Altererythrobacter sp. BO-6]|uniref:hypothetical protein n=1 Tax=Altererythrobacter sp. BO-6 TaxID=2604537 RepID=UPI0013E17292|nr:hypothetical protein [Altererythrobacter sp. BO-6]QIG52759.1 hypothetical protein G6N82_12365 [Altererythrobacter sp. BO-6]